MSVAVACPRCGESYRIAESLDGQSVLCRHCGRRFRAGARLGLPIPLVWLVVGVLALVLVAASAVIIASATGIIASATEPTYPYPECQAAVDYLRRNTYAGLEILRWGERRTEDATVHLWLWDRYRDGSGITHEEHLHFIWINGYLRDVLRVNDAE